MRIFSAREIPKAQKDIVLLGSALVKAVAHKCVGEVNPKRQIYKTNFVLKDNFGLKFLDSALP